MKFLVIDRPDSWHVNELLRAAAPDISIVAMDYRQLAVRAFGDSHSLRSHFTAAGESLGQFDGVLNRAMPAATLEQIVFRMDWLDQLQRQFHLPVVNSAKAVESCIDKYLSLERMRDAGIPTPKTAVAQTATEAMRFFVGFGEDAVVKPIFGSRGRNIVRLQNRGSAADHFNRLEDSGQVIYLQEYLEHGDTDLRLLVVGEHVFAMRRERPGHWIVNASQGARCRAHQPSPDETKLAIDATRAQNAIIGGVDIVETSRGLIVIEVNACPSWRAIQQTTKTDIAQSVIELLIEQASDRKLTVDSN